MERILYQTSDACAIVENGRLVEYISLPDSVGSGVILMARINRMMPALECAFADIGRKKDGFLPLAENSQTFTGTALHSGDLIPVQIRREETGEKGAFLSRDLVISGRYVILMPCNRHIGISSRIEDEDQRMALRCMGMRIAARETGLVMRAASAGVPEEEIARETETLQKTWRTVQENIRNARNPGDIVYSCDTVSQLVSDYGAVHSQFVTEMPEFVKRELSAASHRKVPLKSGGNLIIDRCEALTAIDVNTASIRGNTAKEKTFTAVNMEACAEAAIQIRLRDISGIILIDFIDMDLETDRSLVLKTLREALLPDRRKTVLHGWTRLGLMEMTRKRV